MHNSPFLSRRQCLVIVKRRHADRRVLSRAFSEEGFEVYDTAYLDAAQQWLDRHRADALNRPGFIGGYGFPHLGSDTEWV